MDIDALRLRWLTPLGREKKQRILLILAKGKSQKDRLIKNADLTDEELIDLRGLTFDKGIRFNDVSFQRIDFSYSKFANCVFDKCSFEQCRLCDIYSVGWNERGCHFVEVSFKGSCFTNAAIGIECSIYHKVDFSDADFSRAIFYCPQFRSCNFSNARITGIDFNASNFIDCKFMGRIENVWYRRSYPFKGDEKRFGRTKPNEMIRVDFSEAELWGA